MVLTEDGAELIQVDGVLTKRPSVGRAGLTSPDAMRGLAASVCRSACIHSAGPHRRCIDLLDDVSGPVGERKARRRGGLGSR